MSTSATVFQKFARGIDARRPDEAVVARRCAEEPFVLSLIPDDSTWDVPSRLMAAVQWLIIGGEAPLQTAGGPLELVPGDPAREQGLGR